MRDRIHPTHYVALALAAMASAGGCTQPAETCSTNQLTAPLEFREFDTQLTPRQNLGSDNYRVHVLVKPGEARELGSSMTILPLDEWPEDESVALYSHSQLMDPGQTLDLRDQGIVVYLADLDAELGSYATSLRGILARVDHGLVAKVSLLDDPRGFVALALSAEFSRLDRPIHPFDLAETIVGRESFVIHFPVVHRASIQHGGAVVDDDGLCIMGAIMVGTDPAEVWCRVEPRVRT